ncbi:hypothetical protein [Humibacter ginsenosidimutans]|uniref:Uncharacterized protein n=1 Tax=Humibacter ginsenosidimutans TaxID=2599293 RepID=A0A5B8M3N7_9MICO|nr:hypothetical protein [Humibacter ginsenosidimutans]QDZ14771.1 hypothetical protein FPZ11_08370 [Humibacter ginsenosidimutans]
MSRSRSATFAAFLDQWAEIRADYDLVLQAAYERAEEVTRGKLLNRRGRRAGIDAYSLFLGPAVRAYAYASDELIEHWRTHPRITFEAFEQQALIERRWR